MNGLSVNNIHNWVKICNNPKSQEHAELLAVLACLLQIFSWLLNQDRESVSLTVIIFFMKTSQKLQPHFRHLFPIELRPHQSTPVTLRSHSSLLQEKIVRECERAVEDGHLSCSPQAPYTMA